MKARTIRQQVTVKGTTPHELYETIMDSRRHTKLTGDKAKMSRKVGAKFTAGGGWISGLNVELVKDKLIVQAWRGNDDDWPAGYYSAVRFRFTKVPGGARLDFLHSGIPAAAYDMIRDGWLEYYWEPLKRTFEK
jgi:activator of HSP90 ATPase